MPGAAGVGRGGVLCKMRPAEGTDHTGDILLCTAGHPAGNAEPLKGLDQGSSKIRSALNGACPGRRFGPKRNIREERRKHFAHCYERSM